MTGKICQQCGAEFEGVPTKKYCSHRCCNRAKTERFNAAHPGRKTKLQRDASHRRGIRPMAEAKDCSAYLGIYVAERALSKFFDNIFRMPMNYPGIDFRCGKGFGIDVKSACLTVTGSPNRCPHWTFNIRKNCIADYFLCLAFRDRETLEPMHVWLIPGKDVNQKQMIVISNKPECIANMEKYERPLNRVNCCMKRMVPDDVKLILAAESVEG